MATATKQPTLKQSETIRISAQSHRRLREMAEQSGEPMQVVLDKALEQYRRQRFFEECNAAYAALQNDPEALAAEKEELTLWEVTLMDGLDPNEVWTDDGDVYFKEEKLDVRFREALVNGEITGDIIAVDEQGREVQRKISNIFDS